MILNADLADGLAIADAVRITRAVNLGDTAYIHSDHLGTPQKMTDAGGSIVWDRVARPFGATHSESGSLATDLRFPGQLHDAESGLHYNYFRDYDPTLGRYIQSDPIGLRGGINTYAYVGGSPTRYVDPTGEIAPALAALVYYGFPVAIGATIYLSNLDNYGALQDAYNEVFRNDNEYDPDKDGPIEIDPDLPIPPQLPGYQDPDDIQMCEVSEPPQPPLHFDPKESCFTGATLARAKCLSKGNQPSYCLMIYWLTLLGCLSQGF